MLSELNQLLTCRREREDRAASALRRVRAHHAVLTGAVAVMAAELDVHHQERKARQSQLYKQSLRSRMTAQQVDDLNIELDLMGEQTEALVTKLRAAEDQAAVAADAVEQAAAIHKKHSQASDRWQHLVDDVGQQVRRDQNQAEEFAIEDDLSDRWASRAQGAW